MSIIEKALNKIEQENSERRDQSGELKSPRPDEDSREDAPFAEPPLRESMTDGMSRGAESATDSHQVAQVAPGSTLEAEGRRAKDPGFKPISRKVSVNLEKLSRAGLITPESASSLIAEQFRHIKRPLLAKAAKNGAREKLILVTSAFPEEGKTFMSINLAMSIAMEVDQKVLLVDTDVFKSGVCRLLGAERALGLTDVLCNAKLQLSDVLMKTNVSSLDLLSPGQAHIHLTELFASTRMKQVVEELWQRYDIVIFDSTPVLGKGGSSVLGTLMGQIVFVVESIRTSRRAVREALSLLDAQGSIGLVLNKSRQRSSGNYGYHDYNGYSRW